MSNQKHVVLIFCFFMFISLHCGNLKTELNKLTTNLNNLNIRMLVEQIKLPNPPPPFIPSIGQKTRLLSVDELKKDKILLAQKRISATSEIIQLRVLTQIEEASCGYQTIKNNVYLARYIFGLDNSLEALNSAEIANRLISKISPYGKWRKEIIVDNYKKALDAYIIDKLNNTVIYKGNDQQGKKLLLKAFRIVLKNKLDHEKNALELTKNFTINIEKNTILNALKMPSEQKDAVKVIDTIMPNLPEEITVTPKEAIDFYNEKSRKENREPLEANGELIKSNDIDLIAAEEKNLYGLLHPIKDKVQYLVLEEIPNIGKPIFDMESIENIRKELASNEPKAYLFSIALMYNILHFDPNIKGWVSKGINPNQHWIAMTVIQENGHRQYIITDSLNSNRIIDYENHEPVIRTIIDYFENPL